MVSIGESESTKYQDDSGLRLGGGFFVLVFLFSTSPSGNVRLWAGARGRSTVGMYGPRLCPPPAVTPRGLHFQQQPRCWELSGAAEGTRWAGFQSC